MIYSVGLRGGKKRGEERTVNGEGALKRGLVGGAEESEDLAAMELDFAREK